MKRTAASAPTWTIMACAGASKRLFADSGCSVSRSGKTRKGQRYSRSVLNISRTSSSVTTSARSLGGLP